MNKEHYYTTRTDRERLSSSQRQVMSLEHKVTELSDEIVRLTIKSDKDDEMIEQSYQTITDLTSKSLRLQVLNKEQTPMYMLNTLEDCYTAIKNHTLGTETTLLKDLRNVIKFLQQ